ncbi:MAG: hypothetical protein R3C58_10080 [Parvularculaceae bacterium]
MPPQSTERRKPVKGKNCAHANSSDDRRAHVDLGEFIVARWRNSASNDANRCQQWGAAMSKSSAVLSGIACSALFFTSVSAEKPEIDPGDLPDFFAGSWTIKGMETSFLETCEWLHPNSFLVCNTIVSDPDAPEKIIRLIGYSHAENTYNLTIFSSDGGKMTLTGWLDGDVWKFAGENRIYHRATGVDVLRRQEQMKPTKEGYNLKVEISVNGEPWKIAFEDEFVRIKSAPN